MSALAVSAIKGLVETPPEAASVMPISLQAIKYLSAASAMTAIAVIIYGIAAHIIPFIAIGTLFMAGSFSSFYLIHQMVDLKTIEEESAEINKLNENLSAKDAQIEKMTLQMRAISEKFAAQNKEYLRLSEADNAAQKLLNQQLQRSAELLAKTQADRQKKMELFRASANEQLQQFQKQSEIDQKTIADLNQSIAKVKEQNGLLQALITDLQKQSTSYQQQTQTYANLNTQLEQKLKTISQAVQSPGIDISAINTHAEALENAIAKQKLAVEKAARTAEQINSTLKAINQRLPASKAIQPTGK